MENENLQSGQPDVNQLQAQCDSLRQNLVNVLVLVVVLSCTFNTYLWRRVRDTHRDALAVESQVAPAVAEFQQVSGPRIRDFISRLGEYARTHPDFAPILTRHGVTLPGNPPAPTGAPGAPVPAPAPPKK